MEICIVCKDKTNYKCICTLFFCLNHLDSHLNHMIHIQSNHTFQKLKPFPISHKKDPAKKLFKLPKAAPLQEQNLRFSSPQQAKEILIKNYGLHLEGHTNCITSLAISSKSEFIVSRSLDTTIRF